jgi:hypothetical protein
MCLIAVPLLQDRNPFAVQLNDNNNNYLSVGTALNITVTSISPTA